MQTWQRFAYAVLFHSSPLHCQLGLEILDIAEYRGYGKHTSIAFVSQQAILGFDIAINCDFVPLLSVPDIVDRRRMA